MSDSAPLRATTAAVLSNYLVFFAGPARAQVTFPGATPVSAGNVIIYAEPRFMDLTNGVSNTVDKNIIIYGASPDLAFILQNNSFVFNSATIGGNGRPLQHVTASGFGDTTLEGRYTVYQQDGPGSTFRIAPYAGVIIPTGMDNANSLMPRAGQPGTGAWATRDALTMTYQTLEGAVSAEAGYQANSTAAGYRFGNTFFADAAFRYRLWPLELDTEVSGEVYASLESNYTSTMANSAGGGNVPGTSGQLLLIDPGIIYTTRLYSMNLTAFLPAYENVHGNGTRVNYGVMAAFRYSFFTPLHF